MSTPTHLDPAAFPLRELERSMVRSKRLAASCRLIKDTARAELHLMWMDILLDEWSRRRATA